MRATSNRPERTIDFMSHENTPEKSPNYSLRRALAASALILVTLGTWKAGELVVDAKSHIAKPDAVVGCETVSVIPSDEGAITAVNRGVEKIGQETGEYPAFGRETQAAAAGLGVVHPGDEIEVCLYNGGPLLGNYATVNPDSDGDTMTPGVNPEG